MLVTHTTTLLATALAATLARAQGSSSISSTASSAAASPTEDPWLASGCSMAPESALMQCLGDYASVPPVAPTGLPEVEQAAYYCDIYQQLANCWAAGLYCREWQPMQLAADKFCALANSTSSVPSATTTLPVLTTTAAPSVPTRAAVGGINTLSSVAEEAANVITSIWNNDSGTDIPVISNDLATETRATWTHMTTSSPLPATDPLGSAASTIIASSSATTSIPAPARVRRKVRFAREA